MELGDQKILFLGLGFELGVVLKHMITNLKINPTNIAFTRRDSIKASKQVREYNITYIDNNIRAIDTWIPNIIFIGVRPQDLPAVLMDLNKANLKTVKEIIFITSSLPYTLITEMFPNITITNVIPDDYIDINNSSNIINYCTNDTKHTGLTVDIFAKTCSTLEKVEPRNMNLFTTYACQGTPIAYLALMKYLKTNINHPLVDYMAGFFSKLSGEFSEISSEDKIINSLYTGYIESCNTSELGFKLSKNILHLAFVSMINKLTNCCNDTNSLLDILHLWATKGGYEERGIEVIDQYIDVVDVVSLPKHLLIEMYNRGNKLTEDIVINYNKLKYG